MVVSVRQTLLRHSSSKARHGGMKPLFRLKKPMTGGRADQRVSEVKLSGVGFHERTIHNIWGRLYANPPSAQWL